MACIARGEGEEGAAFTDSPDNLYRLQVDVYEFVKKKEKDDSKGAGEAKSEAKKGGDDDDGAEKTPDDFSGKLFARRTGYADVYDSIGGEEELRGISKPDKYDLKDAGKRWKLVYFDSKTGEEVGYAFDAGGGSVASHSCWASFNFKVA